MDQVPARGHGSLAAQKVSIRTPLADVETFEKETATFHLELSHPGVSGVWMRDGIRVKPSSTCRISATGCGHSLTLEGLTLEDSGTVTFTADTLRCSARLLVRGTVTGAGLMGCMAPALPVLQPFGPRGDARAELGHSRHMLAGVPLSQGKRCELSSGDPAARVWVQSQLGHQ